jgi:hypothetical protein
VYDLVRFTLQEFPQSTEARQIPKRTYVSSDNIHVHEAQTMASGGLLEGGVSGQNVNVPTLGLCYLTQPQDDSGGSTEARVADNVKKPYCFWFLMGEHRRNPLPGSVDAKPFGVPKNNSKRSG